MPARAENLIWVDSNASGRLQFRTPMIRRTPFHLLAALTAWLLFLSASWAGEQIYLPGTINGKPVRFLFDSGSPMPVLITRIVAEKLAIAVPPPPPGINAGPSKVLIWNTPPDIALGIHGQALNNVSIGVYDSSAYVPLEYDGIIGWPMIRKSKFAIYDVMGTLTMGSVFSGPPVTSAWAKLRILPDWDVLALELTGSGDKPSIIVVDTGNDNGGVSLSPEKWREWKDTHAHQPATLELGQGPAEGMYVREVSWADEIVLGGVVLRDVPVREMVGVEIHQGPLGSDTSVACLGMVAVHQLNLVIDGEQGWAYVHSGETPPPVYHHNRLGAVFAPKDADKNDDLIAQVVEGSPAALAGVHDGDLLLSIDQLDVTKWRTLPMGIFTPDQYWKKPVGTKMKLTLRRGGDTLQVTVTLKDILIPQTK